MTNPETPVVVESLAADPAIPNALHKAMVARGFLELTAVQRAVLAPEAKGRNLRISSQTGSGKTHAMGSGGQAGRNPPGLIQMTVAQLFAQLPPGATVRAYFVQASSYSMGWG